MADFAASLRDIRARAQAANLPHTDNPSFRFAMQPPRKQCGQSHQNKARPDHTRNELIQA